MARTDQPELRLRLRRVPDGGWVATDESDYSYTPLAVASADTNVAVWLDKLYAGIMADEKCASEIPPAKPEPEPISVGSFTDDPAEYKEIMEKRAAKLQEDWNKL